MRKAKVNPCERKGEVTGTSTPDSYTKGATLRYSACECCYQRCDVNKEGKTIPLRYFLETEGANAGKTIWATNKHSAPNSAVQVSPCSETFRDTTSPGTEAFRAEAREKTQFKGCQDVEEGLIERALVRLWISNRERLELSDILDEVVPTEDDHEVPVSKETFGTFARALAYQDEVGLDERRFSVRKIADRVSVLSNSMSDVLRPAPLTLRQSHARKLFEEGHYITSPKLRRALFLISKNITEPDLIKEVAPDLDYIQYKQLEGVVNAEIDKTMPEKFKRFVNFLELLTPSQRKAVDMLYLNNTENKTQAEIGKKLKISVDSLADRLSGVTKKLIATYPEFKTRGRKSKTGKDREPGEAHCPRSGKEKKSDMVLLYQVDPKSGERKEIMVERSSKKRIRIKEGVNRNEIRRRIRELCPIPYPAI